MNTMTLSPSSEVDLAVRLLIACVLGGLIGLDREVKDRPAGLRTHMLTALAAAVFTVITFKIFVSIGGSGSGKSGDPIRVVEAVTAGVAFIAAGAIIQSRGAVKGLTTGAGMWLAGAIGVAAGAGYYIVAGIATFYALVILEVVKRLENGALSSKSSDQGGTEQR